MTFGWMHVIHVLAATIWVGGAFILALPVWRALGAGSDSDKTQIWGDFARAFSIWAWISMILLWVSGFWLIIEFTGFGAGMHIDLMMTIAIPMTIVFLIGEFAYRKKTGDDAMVKKLRRMTHIVAWLGIITVGVASWGPF